MSKTCTHPNKFDGYCIHCWAERARHAESMIQVWKRTAERLSVFAGAYASHPLRNPTDKLDEVFEEYEQLKMGDS